MNDEFTFEESLKLLKVMHQSFFTLNCQVGTSTWIQIRILIRIKFLLIHNTGPLFSSVLSVYTVSSIPEVQCRPMPLNIFFITGNGFVASFSIFVFLLKHRDPAGANSFAMWNFTFWTSGTACQVPSTLTQMSVGDSLMLNPSDHCGQNRGAPVFVLMLQAVLGIRDIFKRIRMRTVSSNLYLCLTDPDADPGCSKYTDPADPDHW